MFDDPAEGDESQRPRSGFSPARVLPFFRQYYYRDTSLEPIFKGHSLLFILAATYFSSIQYTKFNTFTGGLARSNSYFLKRL